MKGLKNFYVCLFSALVGCTCILSLPSLSARYKKTFTEQNAFEIEFPIINVGEVVANTLGAQFSEKILNNPENYNSMIDQMTISGLRDYLTTGRWNYDSSYMGNVTGEDNSDTQKIEELFGLGDNGSLQDANGIPVTIMIKREKLDNSNSPTTGESSGNFAGCEITLYTTAVDLSTTSSGQEIDVFAMVYSKVDTANGGDGKWYLIAQYQGKAKTNDYSGREGSNSFNTATWVSTEVYYTEENTEIAIGTGLSDLVQSERLAQRNLSIIIAGGTVPA